MNCRSAQMMGDVQEIGLLLGFRSRSTYNKADAASQRILMQPVQESLHLPRGLYISTVNLKKAPE